MKTRTVPLLYLLASILSLVGALANSSLAAAESGSPGVVAHGKSRSPEREGEMQFFAGFGEIPFRSDSFKPALGLSYRRSFWELGVYHQFEDSLRRDAESFNADFGQTGLASAKEKTGSRSMLQLRIFPGPEWFYLTAGLMHSDGDVEGIEFSRQSRLIGASTYDTSLGVTIDRSPAIKPILGFGFRVPIAERLRWTTDFSMDWFTDVPSPEIQFTADAAIDPSDGAALENRIRKNYRNNFHNRYHVFSIGLQYRF